MQTVVAAVLLCVCGYATSAPVPASVFTWTGGRDRPMVSGPFLSDDINHFHLEFPQDYSLFDETPQEQMFPEPGRYVLNGPYGFVSERVYQREDPTEAEAEAEWVAPGETRLDEETSQPEPQPDMEAQYQEIMRMVNALLKSVERSHHRRPLTFK